MTRIADGYTSAHVAYEVKFTIGYHNCKACGKETPTPAQGVLNKIAEYHFNGGGTVWPTTRPARDGDLLWKVPGWTNNSELGDICDDCSRAVADLLRSRKASATGRSKDAIDGRNVSPAYAMLDHAVLRKNASEALVLAEGGLLTSYPPPPEMSEKYGEYPYKIPGSPQRFQRREDYREGMLRRRIRQIRCALLGVPFDE